ncbi:hypothetical protein [Burkholderia gladioli]|uniref:hypothetical protein n=1 Tax=Burkholderia gladioli TaxID=28095 RepID=UPI00163EC4D8|nr:hypothetical protein [Burkholderia gladioli]
MSALDVNEHDRSRRSLPLVPNVRASRIFEGFLRADSLKDEALLKRETEALGPLGIVA